MINIAYMVDAPYVGGAERYIELLVKHLDRRQFRPSLIASSAPGIDTWCAHIATLEVAVSRVDMRLPFRPAGALPLLRVVGRQAPHIAHVNLPGPYDGQMGLLAPLARLAGARTTVVTEHLPMVERLWKRALVKAVAYRWVDRVLTVCRDNVRYLEGRQNVRPSRIAVVHNGIPDPGQPPAEARARWRAHFGVSDDAFAAVYVGSLIERKGLHVLLRAMRGLTSCALHVAGSGPDREAFETQCAALGLNDAVTFHGELSDDQVGGLLQAGDALVLPSFMEGFPYVILEAMAAGRPVLSTSVNGIPEAVEQGVTGWLVPPGDADALRSGLERLRDGVAVRREMGIAGRARFLKYFTIEAHTKHMEQIYREALFGGEGAGRAFA